MYFLMGRFSTGMCDETQLVVWQVRTHLTSRWYHFGQHLVKYRVNPILVVQAEIIDGHWVKPISVQYDRVNLVIKEHLSLIRIGSCFARHYNPFRVATYHWVMPYLKYQPIIAATHTGGWYSFSFDQPDLKTHQ